MSMYVNYGLVNTVPKKTVGFSTNDTQLANQLATQAFTMNCNEVHVSTPHRIGDSVLIVGPGSKFPIKVHFHGLPVNTVQNQSSVTFVMQPSTKFVPAGNTFNSYGISYKR